ncbi:hypothetical protein LTR17_005378 [Elasticomyces elasticus]|nr:hypothetical protein LTR17_005378 [Elasticomyces elasticus]
MADATTTKKKKRTAKSKKAIPLEPAEWQPPPARTPNILMTLPPELRNMIFEEALVEIRHIRMFRQPNYKKSHNSRRKQWREPELLQVSKAVRQEASAIYYGHNDFDIEINLPNMPELCRRLQIVVARCGCRPFGSLRIMVLDGNWECLAKGRLLGLLFCQTGLQIHPGRRRGSLWYKYERDHYDPDKVIFLKYDKIEAALQTAMKLGTKGAREGWDQWRMEGAMDDWLATCLKYKSSPSKSKKWKLAMQV